MWINREKLLFIYLSIYLFIYLFNVLFNYYGRMIQFIYLKKLNSLLINPGRFSDRSNELKYFRYPERLRFYLFEYKLKDDKIYPRKRSSKIFFRHFLFLLRRVALRNLPFLFLLLNASRKVRSYDIPNHFSFTLPSQRDRIHASFIFELLTRF